MVIYSNNVANTANDMSFFSQSYKEQSDKLAGPIGFLKQYATSTGRATAADATLIFGGRAITTTGMGKLIENVRVNELKVD